MKHQAVKANSLYYGFPVLLLTTIDPITGVANITPLSSSWTLIDKIVIGIAQQSQGFRNIQPGSQAVINVPASHQWNEIEKNAQKTGMLEVPAYKQKMGYTYDADKFATSGFSPKHIPDTAVPAIAECPLQIAADIENITEREQFAIVELSISQVLAAESILDQNGQINSEAWSPLIYQFRAYKAADTLLGYNFRYNK